MVFSTGGNDKTCLVWETDLGESDGLFGGGAGAEEESVESDGIDVEEEMPLETAKVQR